MDPQPSYTTRNVPMQVLSLGLPRTGTASMQSALQILGYNHTTHGFDMISHPEVGTSWMEAVNAKFLNKGKPYGRAEFDAFLGHCAAVTDMPCAAFWEELIAAYPEAKIILVERNVEDWYQSFDVIITELFSRAADVSVEYLEPMVCGSRIALMSRKMIYGYFHANTPSQLRQNARGVYQEHYKRIRQAAPKDKLLEYRLGDGWEPLCKFLGKNMPEGIPFPKKNEAAALRAKFRDEQWKLLKKAAMALIKYLVPVFIIAMLYWYRRAATSTPRWGAQLLELPMDWHLSKR